MMGPHNPRRIAAVGPRHHIERWPISSKPRSRSTNRVGAKTPRRSGVSRPRDFNTVTKAFADALLKATREIDDGPLAVLQYEHLASEFGGNIVRGLDDPADIPSATGDLFAEIARRRDRRGLALLHAFAAVMSDPAASIAAEAAKRMREHGVPDPAWAVVVGHPTFTSAWHGVDELEDQAILAIEFDYPALGRHVVHVMLDANFQGLIRQASIGGSIDELRSIWSEHDLRIRDVDAQEASDLLANGLHWFDDYLDPPVYDDAPPLVELLRARLRVLPARHPIERPELPDAERRRIARAFARSREAVKGADNELLASWFIDFAADHGAGDPLRWSPIAVEMCLLDFFPRKVVMDPEAARDVPRVLRAFVRYAGGRKKLSASAIAETLETVRELEAEFLAAMANKTAAGPATLLMRAAMSEGVDLADPAALQRWIGDFNARPFDERDRILGPALGVPARRAPKLGVVGGGRPAE
jgi:hypothetical protein